MNGSERATINGHNDGYHNGHRRDEDDMQNGHDERNKVKLKNPNLTSMREDSLYHLALNTRTHDLKAMFGDVKFVCIGGTLKRMRHFASFIGRELGLETDTVSHDITEASGRYSMFKVGPVLSVTHGMGIPSVSILLHELLKLIHYAECKDVLFFRIGTCGGLGIEPGSIIITKCAVDGLLRPFLELPVLGGLVRRPAVLDKTLINELIEVANEEFPNYKTVVGNTMCTLDFYEGQARMDGAFCDFTHTEQMEYLRKLKLSGIVNIEMESLAFAAMCNHAGVRSAVVCTPLLDRLREDQVVTPKHVLEKWEHRPQELVVGVIKKRLAKAKNGF